MRTLEFLRVPKVFALIQTVHDFLCLNFLLNLTVDLVLFTKPVSPISRIITLDYSQLVFVSDTTDSNGFCRRWFIWISAVSAEFRFFLIVSSSLDSSKLVRILEDILRRLNNQGASIESLQRDSQTLNDRVGDVHTAVSSVKDSAAANDRSIKDLRSVHGRLQDKIDEITQKRELDDLQAQVKKLNDKMTTQDATVAAQSM